MRKLAALCGALLMTLVLAAPAAALQKEVIEFGYVFPEDGGTAVSLSNPEWTLDLEESWACSGKDIYYQTRVELKITDWYKNDEWVKAQIHWLFVDSFAADPAMSLKVVTSKSRPVDHFFSDGSSMTTGQGWALNIPGLGTVFHESGVLKVTAEGDKSFRGNVTLDYAELCDYFEAGPPEFLP